VVLDATGHIQSAGRAEETLTPAILEGVFGVSFHLAEIPGGPPALIPCDVPL
jgi:ABC-type cobalamin transport system ATPase subunit